MIDVVSTIAAIVARCEPVCIMNLANNQKAHAVRMSTHARARYYYFFKSGNGQLAEASDPQLRILLEVVLETIIGAG